MNISSLGRALQKSEAAILRQRRTVGNPYTRVEFEEKRPRTFTFSDCHASLLLPFGEVAGGRQFVELPGLNLLSYSTHRDKFPVVAQGNRGIQGMTRGHRTVAGSLGFVPQFGEPFLPAIQAYCRWIGIDRQVQYVLPDELPPMDLVVLFLDEGGYWSRLAIRSIQIVDMSSVLSVSDIRLNQNYSFMAESITNLVLGEDIEHFSHEAEEALEALRQVRDRENPGMQIAVDGTLGALYATRNSLNPNLGAPLYNSHPAP